MNVEETATKERAGPMDRRVRLVLLDQWVLKVNEVNQEFRVKEEKTAQKVQLVHVGRPAQRGLQVIRANGETTGHLGHLE